MWLEINRTLDNEQILLAAGKSLCLCQKFETTCKGIIMWLSSTKYVKDKKADFLSNEHYDYVDQLLSRQLGQSISELEKNFGSRIKPIDIETLKKAKVSRNYICHELLKGLILASFTEKSGFNGNKELLKDHLRNIASADYIVSKWSFEFQEKRSGAFYDQQKYIDTIIHWVLG